MATRPLILAFVVLWAAFLLPMFAWESLMVRVRPNQESETNAGR